MSHLKKGADGHLLKNAAGHLVKDCHPEAIFTPAEDECGYCEGGAEGRTPLYINVVISGWNVCTCGKNCSGGDSTRIIAGSLNGIWRLEQDGLFGGCQWKLLTSDHSVEAAWWDGEDECVGAPDHIDENPDIRFILRRTPAGAWELRGHLEPSFPGVVSIPMFYHDPVYPDDITETCIEGDVLSNDYLVGQCNSCVLGYGGVATLEATT